MTEEGAPPEGNGRTTRFAGGLPEPSAAPPHHPIEPAAGRLLWESTPRQGMPTAAPGRARGDRSAFSSCCLILETERRRQKFPVSSQAVTKSSPGPCQTALDRPQRFPDHPSDLSILIALDIGQDRDHPEFVRQPAQTILDRAAQFGVLGGYLGSLVTGGQTESGFARVAVRLGAQLFDRCCRTPFPTPKLVVACVGHDSQEPSLERPATISSHVAIGGAERLLGCVGGRVGITHDAQRNIENTRLMSQDKTVTCF